MQAGELSLGHDHPLATRTEEVDLFAGRARARLLYASDLHLRRGSHAAASRLVDAVAAAAPDVVLLGGDLVDGSGAGPLVESCVRRLVAVAPVLAISGNHDRFWGATAVRAAVERGGGHWLEGRSATVLPDLRIDGGIEAAVDPRERRVLCAHDPSVFPEAAAAGYALVLAGHLHGCQCVLAERDGRLFPGAFVYRWNGLRFSLGDATMLVSRGAGDTIPVRYRCPHEVIQCEVRLAPPRSSRSGSASSPPASTATRR